MAGPREHASPQTYDAMLAALGPANVHARVLDAGAGEGAFTLRLQRHGFARISACDIQPRRFRNRTVRCRRVNLNDGLPYATGSFDTVFAVEVIEHLENPWHTIREFHRVLTKGGTLVITTPNMHHWINRILSLLGKQPLGFREADFRENGHITPIYHWNFLRMTERRFKIKRITFNRSRVPLLRVDLPWKGFLWSENTVYILTKIRRD